MKLFLLGLFLGLFSNSFAKEIIQIGIATPQLSSDINNIEKLRERAIKNAMEIAIMQITGVKITSEKNTVDSYYRLSSSKKVDTDKQISSFYTGAKTKATGHAKLLEIIKEWQENDNYYVEAKIKVLDTQALPKSFNVGDLWDRINRPTIEINVTTNQINRQIKQSQLFKKYLQENLSRNRIDTTSLSNVNSKYSIEVNQVFNTMIFKDLGNLEFTS